MNHVCVILVLCHGLQYGKYLITSSDPTQLNPTRTDHTRPERNVINPNLHLFLIILNYFHHEIEKFGRFQIGQLVSNGVILVKYVDDLDNH